MGSFPPGCVSTTIDNTQAPPNNLSSWTSWSPQAMLLPYVEQTPLYNAANFSWACCWDGNDDPINITVYTTKINSFLCPSDAIAGIGNVASYTANINSYAGSIGTTTTQYPNDGNTSGVFKLYNPNTNQASATNLAELLDGTSNTVAFGEGLVGDNGKKNNYRGNGMAGAPATAGYEMLDARQNPAAITLALQSCNTFWAGNTLVSDATGLKQYEGQVWAQGERGFTLFNMVVTPNSKNYPWRSCRLTGCLDCAMEGSSFTNSSSYHPGGCNFAFADGSVKFLKDTISTQVYWALGTRAGGEVISSDSY
jgi:prepilin-type processing-associated H-X9-DG protein